MDGSVLSRPIAGEGAPREFALIRYRGHKIGAVDFAILDSFSGAFWARSLWWSSPFDVVASVLAKNRVELDLTTGDQCQDEQRGKSAASNQWDGEIRLLC